MILIADVGGTKSSWRLLDGEHILQFETDGYNPHTHELAEFISALNQAFEEYTESVKKVHFYGASIYPHDHAFGDALKSIFVHADILLNNDLLAACRAVSATEPGFVGILGTGSAGCFYDGSTVAIHPPSLGYILGDEGSGMSLGRRLISLALRKKLDEDLQREFDETFQLTKFKLYDHVYKGSHPNTYLAS